MRLSILRVAILILISSACTKNAPSKENVVRVGIIDGPEAKLMEVAAQIAKKKYNLDVKLVIFSDYNTPNIALHDGSIDANMFQHVPYLNSQVKTHKYKFSVVGKTFIYPMALYSNKVKNIDDILSNSIIAIQNDPSNEARALLLLEKAKLIVLRPGAGDLATPLDIISNPKKLVFRELDAAQLPRVLPDVTVCVINTNFAVIAGLVPKRDGIFLEDKSSPYANIVVARDADKEQPKFKQLVEALHSPEVFEIANKLFQGNVVQGW